MTEGVWGVEFPRSPSFPCGGVHPLEKSLGTLSSLEKLSDLLVPSDAYELVCECVHVCVCEHACVCTSACTTECVPAQVG